jgi:hypothetical protein
MTLAGIVLLDALGVALLIWILELVRRGRLYVGYGVIFILGTSATCLVLSAPPLHAIASAQLARLFPNHGLLVVGLAAVALLLIYIFAQLTVLSNRLAAVVQELAIREASQGRGGKQNG